MLSNLDMIVWIHQLLWQFCCHWECFLNLCSRIAWDLAQQGMSWYHCQGILAGQLADLMFLLKWNFSRHLTDLFIFNWSVSQNCHHIWHVQLKHSLTLLEICLQTLMVILFLAVKTLFAPSWVGRGPLRITMSGGPTGRTGFRKFFNLLNSNILVAFSTGLWKWSWSRRVDSKASACLTMSSSDVRYPALARMSVCND